MKTVPVEFKWHPGFSKEQKQRSIASLHHSAETQRGLTRLLEISSKSENHNGRKLSAFNLTLSDHLLGRGTVETFFQGSKVFEFGGPYNDLYERSSREAKKDDRLRSSGRLIEFKFGDRQWPLEPKTIFYDWLYINAVQQHPELCEEILKYEGFTDIEFNPDKAMNCQAYSAALYKSLHRRNLLESALASPEAFQETISEAGQKSSPAQQSLF
ncbi:MAG: hypothetical protein JAZ11_20685 [Candidatus Thiodiazotropha lotti]|nr:hypothetical protein [Candidatus Thiodiazotropha lotti]